ncbi:hypothetical protein V1514DRAFT_65756 [Lipomyces japonicus]|uniref:uncharacterized protein n=1 Tax=Lipomyces japonicus TaxID=56871 RepID=UPI0034CF5E72
MTEDSEKFDFKSFELLQSSCSICFKQSPAYKCPACLSKYCSIACFKSHKARTSCPGMAEIKDVVLKYVPRNELIGKHGYREIPEHENDDQDEIQKRQRISDRDYNFLSLLERRVGVGKNIAQDILRQRRGNRVRGRGRGRGGRRDGNLRPVLPDSQIIGNPESKKKNPSEQSNRSDSDSDDSSDSASHNKSSASSSPVASPARPEVQQIQQLEESDDDAPPEEASSKPTI